MSDSKSTEKRNNGRSKALEWACEHLAPNCGVAISLIERGIEKPLKTHERLALRYHKRLCPFCGCSEGKLKALMVRYEEAKSARRTDA
jgi:hypothetical protein